MNKITELKTKISDLNHEITELKKAQKNIEISEIFTEDDFEEELHEMYDYEHTHYHMRKLDKCMFRQAYNDHLDMLDRDGFIETTDEYKEIEEEIEALENEILDIEEEIEELEG